MHIAVLGAGSWGTALASVLAGNGHQVLLWSRDRVQVKAMQKHRINADYLPKLRFPETLNATDDMVKAMVHAECVLVAIPSHAFTEVITAAKPHWRAQVPLLLATKGLDASGSLLLEIAARILGDDLPLAVLAGPSFAVEVADGLPTAIAIASKQDDLAKHLASLLNNQRLRVYTTDDVVAVQLGGAVKNVLAIATGIIDGMGLGANARAALITRGLAEMMRLGEALGANPKTLMGLSGLGDLLLTCTDDKSRNRRFGLAVGRGIDEATAQRSIGQVVEGVETAKHVHTLATRLGIDLPISTQVYRILMQEITPKAAVDELLARSLRAESD
jgi:glycerol-3-phosphate dehydrogenase (NAD(P)+)